ncbi:MAG: hypothetical protein AAFZ87_18160 [Planctomycetota bacterium]
MLAPLVPAASMAPMFDGSIPDALDLVPADQAPVGRVDGLGARIAAVGATRSI